MAPWHAGDRRLRRVAPAKSSQSSRPAANVESHHSSVFFSLMLAECTSWSSSQRLAAPFRPISILMPLSPLARRSVRVRVRCKLTPSSFQAFASVEILRQPRTTHTSGHSPEHARMDSHRGAGYCAGRLLRGEAIRGGAKKPPTGSTLAQRAKGCRTLVDLLIYSSPPPFFSPPLLFPLHPSSSFVCVAQVTH